MYKIFYMNKCADLHTDTAIQRLLREHFNVSNARILRTENGKPYVDGCPLFVSVSHTNDLLFLVFSDENVGLDIESLDRDVLCAPIIKKFHITEREEITSAELFLRHWTAKEATVKWLGGTLAKDLYKLDFTDGQMRYGEILLPLHFTFFTIENYLLCICAERLENATPDIEKIVL